MIKKCLGNITISFTDTPESLGYIEERIETGKKTRLFFINSHCYNISQEDEIYCNNVNSAEIVLNDGIGIDLGALIFGFKFRENLNGTDYTPKLLALAAKKNWRVYFLGGMPGVAQRAAEELSSVIPGLQIAGTHDGYFSDNRQIIDTINEVAPDILIVGLGVPTQDNWISAHIEQLDVKLALGVGAFFDFASKRIKRAPLFIRKIKLEWFFRLLLEPKRLWKRYLIGNLKFFYYILKNRYLDSPNARRIPRLSILGTRGIPARHGGFETFAEQLALYLVARGWEVTVYCQSNGGENVRQEVWNGVNLVHIPVSGSDTVGSIIFDWKSTLHAIRQRSLTLTLGYNTAIFCTLYRLFGVVNLINMDGFEWRRKKWSFYQRAWLYLNERCACLVANHLIADHPEIRTHLATRVSRDKTTMIPYGAEVGGTADVALLAKYGLTPGSYALVIARPEPENSIVEIVEAFSARKRGCKLVLVGAYDAVNYPYHARVAAAAGDDTILLGAIYDKQVIFALRSYCRLYIHGHQVGGTNPSLVEAMAAGSPILAHDNPFNRWVAGPAAYYFSDSAACAALLDTLLPDKAGLLTLGHAGLERCTESFLAGDILARYEQLLKQWWQKSAGTE